MSLYNAISYRLLRFLMKKTVFRRFFATIRHRPTFGTVTSACNAVMIGNGIAVWGGPSSSHVWNRDVGLQRRDDWKRHCGLGVETP